MISGHEGISIISLIIWFGLTSSGLGSFQLCCEEFFQLFASSPKLASRRLRLDFTSHNGSVVIMPKFQIAVELPVPIKVVAKCKDDHCIVNLFLKCVGSFNKQLLRLFLFQGCIDWRLPHVLLL